MAGSGKLGCFDIFHGRKSGVFSEKSAEVAAVQTDETRHILHAERLHQMAADIENSLIYIRVAF